jgi:hypothetical protein
MSSDKLVPGVPNGQRHSTTLRKLVSGIDKIGSTTEDRVSTLQRCVDKERTCEQGTL